MWLFTALERIETPENGGDETPVDASWWKNSLEEEEEEEEKEEEEEGAGLDVSVYWGNLAHHCLNTGGRDLAPPIANQVQEEKHSGLFEFL